MLIRACGVTLIVFSGWLSLAAAADPPKRTWDPDLKRWLTEEELGSIEVYLTEEQALKLLFPKSRIHAEDLPSRKPVSRNASAGNFPKSRFAPSRPRATARSMGTR